MDTNVTPCNNSYNFPEWGIEVILKQNYDIIKEIAKYRSNSYYKNFKKDMPPELRQFVRKFPETYVIGISWEHTDFKYRTDDIIFEVGKQLVLLSNFKWLNEPKATSRLVNNKQAFAYGNPCYIIISNGTLETSTRDLVTTAIPFSFYYDIKITNKTQFEKARKQYYLDDDSIDKLLWSYQSYTPKYKRNEVIGIFRNELSDKSLECCDWKFQFGHGASAIDRIFQTIIENCSTADRNEVANNILKSLSEMDKCTAQFNYDYNLFGVAAIIISDSGYDFEIMHSTGTRNATARNDFIHRVKTAQQKLGYKKTILINYDTHC